MACHPKCVTSRCLSGYIGYVERIFYCYFENALPAVLRVFMHPFPPHLILSHQNHDSIERHP